MRLPVMELVAITIASFVLLAQPVHGADGVSVARTSNGTINLKADNTPLNEVVRDLGLKCGFDVKGASLSSERVSLQLTNSSVDETLRKLLRGYNYVLIKTEGSARGSLMVVGRTERVVHTYTPPPATPAPGSAGTQVSPPSPASIGEQAGVMAARQGLPPSLAGIPGPTAAGQRSTLSSASATQTQSTGTSQSSGQINATAGTGASSESLVPPGPPQIAGLDMPPMVPGGLAEMGPGRSGSTVSQGSGSSSTTSSTAQSASVSQQTGTGSLVSTGTVQSGSTSSTTSHGSTSSTTSGGSSTSTSDTSQTQPGGTQTGVVPGTSTGTSTGATTNTTVDLRPPQIPY